MSSSPELVYLNNAATAWPRAPGVAEAVSQALATPPSHPGRVASKRTNEVTECRERLAALLGGVEAERIALTTNATHALNLAIFGFGLESGSHVVTTVTEHNSVLRPLNHLKARGQITVTLVGLDPDLCLDRKACEQALSNAPKLVAVNHVSNVTGRVNEVKELFAQAKSAGALTLLDASQSLGKLPVRPRELEADVVAFTGHKGLRAPAGTGGLYVSPGIELEQVFVGGTGVRSDLELHPSEMPMRLEAGTPNVPALAGLAAALRWLESDGEAFKEEEARAARRLHEGLVGLSGVTVFDQAAGAAASGVVSFNVRGWEPEELGYILSESFGIVCRTGLHCAPLIHEAIGSFPQGTVRFSVSGFTTDEEIDRALGALDQLRT